MKKTIIYITTIRLPSERAHALYVASVLDAFANIGHPVLALAPRRFGRSKKTLREYFSLVRMIPVTYLFTIDITYIPFISKFAYAVYTFTFICTLTPYLFITRKRGACFFVNDMIVAYILSMFGFEVVYEVHDYPVGSHTLYRNTFARVGHILVNTIEKKSDLERDFGVAPQKIIIAPNGVDFEKFNIEEDKAKARERLDLSSDRKIVVYTGSLFAWKGVDTLAKASEHTHANIYIIGGGDDDILRFRNTYAHFSNLHIIGHQPHEKIPLWLRAADVLVIPSASGSVISERYTSPMKLFEYMASGTPIIATDVPSTREILTDDEAWYVEPDNPMCMGELVNKLVVSEEVTKERAVRAQTHSQELSWIARAQSILAMSHIDLNTTI